MNILKNLRVYMLFSVFWMLSLFVFCNSVTIPSVKIFKGSDYIDFKFNTTFCNQTDVPIRFSLSALPNAHYNTCYGPNYGASGSQNTVYINRESKVINVEPFMTKRCMIVFHADNISDNIMDTLSLWTMASNLTEMEDSAKILINGQEVVKTSPYIINVLRTGKDYEQAILTVQQDYQVYYKDSNTNKVYRLQMFVSGDTLSIFVTPSNGAAIN